MVAHQVEIEGIAAVLDPKNECAADLRTLSYTSIRSDRRARGAIGIPGQSALPEDCEADDDSGDYEDVVEVEVLPGQTVVVRLDCKSS